MVRVLKSGDRIATRYPDTPVILRQGFRIFFLAAAVWAILVMAVFVAMLSGTDVVLPAFDAVDWHIHEMLFGYTGAVIAVIIVLIMLIGGRIIPSFTRNWLVQQGRTTLPVPFGRYDGMTLIVSALALACWTLFPGERFAALLLLAAGVLNLLRLVRWQGHRTLSEGLLAILHVAYFFIQLGMLALATSIIAPHVIPPAGALHLLTAGAIAMMTVAVMSRASLGHTGQTLHADALILAIFVALAGSVLLRLFYAITRAPNCCM